MCYNLQFYYKLDSVSYNQSISLHFCGTEILNKSNFVYKNRVFSPFYQFRSPPQGKNQDTLALHLEG